MRDIRDNTVIQIEITNACHLSCQGCTRHVGHHRQPFFMTYDFVRTAIESLDGWNGRVGIMGGEPTLHPRFKEICGLVKELVPEDRREFWTAGWKWGEYETLIRDTFPRINYNDHVAYDGKHKPLMVAIEEVIDDPDLRNELIESCPYQSHWSASVTPRGAYFCEIAASMDWLFQDLPNWKSTAWKVEPGWWKRTVSDYADQISQFCGKCSGAIPMEAISDGRGGRDGPTTDHVSPGNFQRLLMAGSRKVAAGNVKIWDTKITREDCEKHAHLNPREYRSFEAHNPEDVKRAIGT